MLIFLVSFIISLIASPEFKLNKGGDKELPRLTPFLMLASTRSPWISITAFGLGIES